MASRYALDRLPAALKTYQFRKLAFTVPEDPECYECGRPFGEKGDPDDEFEAPCQALELQPCKHLICSECFLDMMHVASYACPQCHTPINATPGTPPRWLERIATSTWFSIHVQLLPKTLKQLENVEDFADLSKKLYRGYISAADAVRLWKLHSNVFLFHLFVFLSVMWVQCLCWILRKATGYAYPELLVLEIAAGDKFPTSNIAVAVLDIVVALGLRQCGLTVDGGIHETLSFYFVFVCFLYGLRSMALMIGLTGALFLLFMDMLVFGMATAVLIDYGMRRDRKGLFDRFWLFGHVLDSKTSIGQDLSANGGKVPE